MNAIIPIPRQAITIRAGTLDDVPFLDSLQKLHSKQVGWMPTAQFEGKVKLGHVLIAEDDARNKVGYCIGNDQYFKRDDVGIIYQLNVLPGKQRALVGAMLLKSMFDRAAYGCKLFCCWCAQDIEANYFWESVGFVPLAFRAGSAKKSRVHIFWQRRIRPDDTTTPYWFPSQTTGGAIREDRLVLPIPPGTTWQDAKPLILPGAEQPTAPKALPAPRAKVPKVAPKGPMMIGRVSGLHIGVPNELSAPPKPERRPREPKKKAKNDPKYIAAARELRDRYLEEVNNGRMLPTPTKQKYDLSRALPNSTEPVSPLPPLALPKAA